MDRETKPNHRLAAIMATDVVGYSKLMESNEAGALAALSRIRETTDSQIRGNRGRIANTAGDSVVAEFGSAVDAVSCAMALQQELSSRTQGADLQVRIGIHLGDIVDKGGDLFGTAVNVAARLEGVAQPGGIVVSAAVRDAIAGKLAASFADLGLKPLKNIEEPLRAYALSQGIGFSSSAGSRTEGLPLPNKPSVAVLPFDDLSGNRDQEYFADGMVEDIITALSRFRGLFVIARNSSFAYKGRAVDVKQVGRELGVRYILEGSVRKSGSKVRINGQLIDASTGAHLWADRFDGGLDDVFDLQDQVTSSVVGAIAPKLEEAEIERARQKPTESLDAYDYFLRGMASYNQWTREGNAEALSSFSQAIELDPLFAAAYGLAARCYTQRKINGWVTDTLQEAVETIRLARRAVELGKNDAVALCFGGWALAVVAGDLDTGAALIDRALAINPNLAAAWYESGWVRVYLGEPEVAIKHSAYAMRLSPLDPLLNRIQAAIATAHFFAGRFDEALSWAEKALQEQPTYATALRVSAASYALAGQPIKAQKAVARLRQLDPALRISNLQDRLPLRRPEDIAKLGEGLRLAGLPE
jgi:TolB-like protein/class 3 adenylate cyclase/tetratricopeptide (TPR) repeat protein